MRVLLIWDEVPETTKFFLIENPSAEELAVLRGANGGLINATDNTDDQEKNLDFINAALSHPMYGTNGIEGEAAAYLNRWHDKEIAKAKLPQSGPFAIVIFTGMIL